MPCVSPPSSVTNPPPSMTVFLVTRCCLVMGIVIGADPQAKVTTPPAAIAAAKSASVQLAGDPVPTTVVGCDTSAGATGDGQVASPLPGGAGGGPLCPGVVARSPAQHTALVASSTPPANRNAGPIHRDAAAPAAVTPCEPPVRQLEEP